MFDGKLSREGVELLQRGDDKGIIVFTTGAGLPLLLDRPTGEGNTLFERQLSLTAESEARAPVAYLPYIRNRMFMNKQKA